MRHPLQDYSSAAGYFVTFVTHQRKRILGRIIKGKFDQSPSGKLVSEIWHGLPAKFSCVTLDAFQVMPDHVHCITIHTDPRLLGTEGRTANLSDIMQWLKGVSARRINKLLGTTGQRFWQEGYEDRVIRDDRALEKFRHYVLTNPQRWQIAGKG